MVAEMKKMSEQLIEQNRTCLAQLNATMDVNGLYRPINFIVGIYIYKQQWEICIILYISNCWLGDYNKNKSPKKGKISLEIPIINFTFILELLIKFTKYIAIY